MRRLPSPRRFRSPRTARSRSGPSLSRPRNHDRKAMSEAALGTVMRQAGGRIVAALAARFRDLDIAEEAFSEACVQAAEAWPAQGMPRDPAAWLYRVAEHRALDALRKQRTQIGRAHV